MSRFLALGVSPQQKSASLQSVDNRGGWVNIIREPYAGAWQKNDEWRVDSVVSYWAVYGCISLIANDIGKLRPCLMEEDADGVYSEIYNSAYSPVILNPNHYQNYIQFKQWWITSLLLYGNMYGLKRRDARGVVNAIYIIDPMRCRPMIGDDGSVYYALGNDVLNGVPASLLVPASEIIHDRINPLFHPLCGVPPLYASALSAQQGLNMQRDASWFFANGARPGGILTAPGAISDETASRLKTHWDENYSGKNAGRVAVLGDGLKFEGMRSTAVDAQFIEQAGFNAKAICSTFHVPPFKLGLGDIPAGQKVQDINQIYYSDCLQSPIEAMELLMTEGLNLPTRLCYELDLEGLLRMDSPTLYDTLQKGVKGSILTPNEARRKINQKPLAGGDTIYMQQQNYSLEALQRRDDSENPFASQSPGSAVSSGSGSANNADNNPNADDSQNKAAEEWMKKAFEALEAEFS